MHELNVYEIEVVNGGYWDWGDVSGSIGYNVGTEVAWHCNNVLKRSHLESDLD